MVQLLHRSSHLCLDRLPCFAHHSVNPERYEKHMLSTYDL
jgi:hypothetical protein